MVDRANQWSARANLSQRGRAMNNRIVVVVCCVCGREKTWRGWEYRDFRTDAAKAVSHGFCERCYETEMNKMRWESGMSQPAAAT